MSLESKTDTKGLDDLNDTELVAAVHDLQTESKRLELENVIFESFIKANEPSLIASMELTLKAVNRMQRSFKHQLAIPTSMTIPISPSSVSKTSGLLQVSDTQSVYSMAVKGGAQMTGPRINFSQKTDLVMREIEEMQNSLKKYIVISHRRKNKLKAEIEETNIREYELKECKDNFEQVIVIEAVEKLTQKIPAEKFVRYMQEWLKNGQIMLEKLRLRTCSLRIQQARLKSLLVQKEELGESVHEVDFEKLKIENKNFQINIDMKNSHLLELKRINGKANLMLTNHKKILHRQDNQLKGLKKTIKTTQKRILELESEDDLSQDEVRQEKERYRHIKKLVKLYEVPDVLLYIRKKAELDEMHKILKTWRRKSNIQKTALSTYTRMMMHVTGITKVRESWYDIDRSKSEDIPLDDYLTSDDNMCTSDTSLN